MIRLPALVSLSEKKPFNCFLRSLRSPYVSRVSFSAISAHMREPTIGELTSLLRIQPMARSLEPAFPSVDSDQGGVKGKAGKLEAAGVCTAGAWDWQGKKCLASAINFG